MEKINKLINMRNDMIRNVESLLFKLYESIGIDTPENHYTILNFVHRRVFESCFPESYDHRDVAYAFKEWIERKDVVKKKWWQS
jgi:hypothetical protein